MFIYPRPRKTPYFQHLLSRNRQTDRQLGNSKNEFTKYQTQNDTTIKLITTRTGLKCYIITAKFAVILTRDNFNAFT